MASTSRLCGPTGEDYRIHDGELILASACPDISRTPPVLLELPASINITEFTPGEYCCTAEKIGNTTDYPLCTTATEGMCVLSAQSANIPFIEHEWCVQQGDDPYCVVDGNSLSQTTITLCEEIEITRPEVRYSTATPAEINGALVGSVSSMYGDPFPRIRFRERFMQEQVVASYTGLNASCAPNEAQGCHSTQVEICNRDTSFMNNLWTNLAPDPVSFQCIELCEERLISSLNVAVDCKTYCSEYSCQEHTVYFGPTCNISPACQVELEQKDVSFSGSNIQSYLIDETSEVDYHCDPAYTWQGERVCVFDEHTMNNPGIIAVDVTRDELQALFDTEVEAIWPDEITDVAFSRLELTTATETICQDVSVLSLQTYCIPNNAVVEIGGEAMTCVDPTMFDSSTTPQNFGDYWCPEGFLYNADVDVQACVVEDEICDVAEPGQTAECANFVGDYYGLYNAGCVDATPIAAAEDALDRTCCYAASFNNYDIYQTTGVVVY